MNSAVFDSDERWAPPALCWRRSIFEALMPHDISGPPHEAKDGAGRYGYALTARPVRGPGRVTILANDNRPGGGNKNDVATGGAVPRDGKAVRIARRTRELVRRFLKLHGDQAQVGGGGRWRAGPAGQRAEFDGIGAGGDTAGTGAGEQFGGGAHRRAS